MSATPFKAGGALTDEQAAIYIERQVDRDALTHLRAMDYLLVIEPRQQGKTSLTNRLMCHTALGDVAFAYLDVTTPDLSTEAAWYQTLCLRILRQLRGFISRDQWPIIPQNSAGWRDFLWDVAALATDAHQRVVIALDEIGAVTFPGATDFFSVLRDVYNSRQAETEFKQLTFLLAGAFHPRDLIKDDKISPFNIAQRVRMDDFTLAQVRELVDKGNWTDEQATALAERIHYWTDGQPYLTQLLCSYLAPDAAPADVDAAVEQLRRVDENHLPPLLERLNSDEKLRKYVDRILAGERIRFYPRENRRQAQLESLGVVKEDAEGFCIIRNRIYQQALTGQESLEEGVTLGGISPPSGTKRVFSLRISAGFDDVWRCLAYTRDLEKQDGAYWATQNRLWWSVTEQEHGLATKSATLHLGINHPNARSLYEFNERRLRLLQGSQDWTVIEVYADLTTESRSDPQATRVFDDFLDSLEKMFARLGYEVIKETQPVGGSDMDYERGLDALRAQLEQTKRYLEFTTLEARLYENLHAERLYGPSETSRSDRARIVNSLNRLALDVLGMNFNDLALGRIPAAGMISTHDLSLVRQLDVTPSPVGITPPVQPRVQDLPFNELSWEQFESLCAALIEAQPVSTDCHLYGVHGDDQRGIDIVATQRGPEGEETWAYQCKQYKEYTPGKLKEALANMVYPADYYVLMLSIPATARLRQIAEEESNVFLWDSKDIARKLKNYPAIVEDFFGPAWRQAFCG